MPEIISQSKAKELGLKRYFSGCPCPKGHVSERLISGQCIECRREFDRAREKVRRSDGRWRNYQKQWTSKNIEKVRASCRKSMAKARENDPQRFRDYGKSWRDRNIQKSREATKKRHQKISDLIAVLREEMPDLLKEFGL